MNKVKQHPPKAAQKLLLLFLRNDLAEEVIGDLGERFDRMIQQKSTFKAKIDYWVQVIHYLRPFAIRKKRIQNLTHYDMFQNYFKIGWRNIIKYKAFSAINVFGLSLAMSVCMLIILMLADQSRYDAFHEKGDRVYRILSNTYATSPFPLAEALKTEYVVAAETVNLTQGPAGDALAEGKLSEMRGYFADPSFFQVFSFELTEGNAATALREPNTAVISQEVANNLFGSDDPIGKTFEFSDRKLSFPLAHDGVGDSAIAWGSFTVTGVIDLTRYKSHLKFDVLMSSTSRPALVAAEKIGDPSTSWDDFFHTYTYVLLKENKSVEDLQVSLKQLVEEKYANIKSDWVKDIKLSPQALADVQLGLADNDTNNRLPLIGYYFLIVLASVIMLTACFNYTNLSIARALTRAKEIGVRKITGARRGSIIVQFLSESIITSLVALVFATGLLYLLAPAFKNLWVNKYLNFELPTTPGVYVIFFVFALVIGIIAGIYPAFYLSGYNPVKALKSLGISQRGKLGLRKALSVSQFVLSLFFITTAILVFNQFKYFMEFDYGFKSENIINIELQGMPYQKLKHELSLNPEVTAISATDIIPGTDRNNGMELIKPGTKDEHVLTSILQTDENFLPNLGIKIVAGTNLPSSENGSSKILISNKALQQLGFQFPQEAIGQRIESRWNEHFEIVGVFEDFSYKMPLNTRELHPIILRNQPNAFEYLNVKVASTDLRGTVAKFEEQWKKIDPIHPFKYEFFDDQLAAMHQGIFDLVSILGFIAFLAIVISCLGLLGMATYTTERRTKEIGIRKVLGAEEFTIAKLLSKEFIKMLALAIFIGVPLSYFVNNLWLQQLTTRVEFGIGTVLSGVLVLLTLGMLTIGSQTLRASKANPVDSLKME